MELRSFHYYCLFVLASKKVALQYKAFCFVKSVLHLHKKPQRGIAFRFYWDLRVF